MFQFLVQIWFQNAKKSQFGLNFETADAEPDGEVKAEYVDQGRIESSTPVDGEVGDGDGATDGAADDYGDYIKHKTSKGVNQFSCCDRATQTTVPPLRVSCQIKLNPIWGKNSKNEILEKFNQNSINRNISEIQSNFIKCNQNDQKSLKKSLKFPKFGSIFSSNLILNSNLGQKFLKVPKNPFKSQNLIRNYVKIWFKNPENPLDTPKDPELV